jgi:serine/threonine protein kinase
MTDFYNAILINNSSSEDPDAMEDSVISMPLAKNRETDACLCMYDFSNVKYGKSLGHGATGRVCEALVPTMHNGLLAQPTRVAAKVMKASQEQKHFQRERVALDHLRHLPCVVKLHGAEEGAIVDGKISNVLYLEHCARGEYFDILEKFTFGLPDQLARHYAREMWSALAQCHQAGVHHRDIKPENILVAEDYSIRMADFGSALTGYQTAAVGYCGTEQYIAPEVSRSLAYAPDAADVWSMGVTIFITLFGIPPFFSATNKCWYFRCVRDGNWKRFWDQQEKARPNAPLLSDTAKAFLQKALDPNPSTRPSAADMLEDEWLTQEMCDGVVDVEAIIEEGELPPLDSL